MLVQGRFKHMNIFGRMGSFSEHRLGQRSLGCLLSVVLVFATLPQNVWAQDQGAPAEALARVRACQFRRGSPTFNAIASNNLLPAKAAR